MDNELILAVKKKDPSKVKQALKNGADVHFKNDEALWMASVNGLFEIVKVLLKSGADPNSQDGAPLVGASQYGYKEIVKYLLANGADPNLGSGFALVIACQNGHLEIFDLLLNDATTPETGIECLERASNEGRVNVIEKLLSIWNFDSKSLNKALGNAISHKRNEVLKILLKEAGNKADFPELIRKADFHQNLPAIEMLLQKGASTKNLSDGTFEIASSDAFPKIVKAILKERTVSKNVLARSLRFAKFYQAQNPLENKFQEVINLLTKAGANPGDEIKDW